MKSASANPSPLQFWFPWAAALTLAAPLVWAIVWGLALHGRSLETELGNVSTARLLEGLMRWQVLLGVSLLALPLNTIRVWLPSPHKISAGLGLASLAASVSAASYFYTAHLGWDRLRATTALIPDFEGLLLAVGVDGLCVHGPAALLAWLLLLLARSRARYEER